MTTTLIIIFIVSYIAFSISALCGGGAGLMLMPLLGRLLPVSQVPAALSIGTFTNSASRLVAFRKDICWKIVRYFVPASLPAVWLGAWLLRFLDPQYLEFAMGIFLISNLTFLFKKPKELNEVDHPSNLALSCIGFAAGFLSGLTGAVGLLFNRFYLRYGLSKESVVATRAANEIILHLVKIILYTLFGLISMKAVSIGAVVAASAVLSASTMKWLLPKVGDTAFKKLGYFAMVLSGMLMLTQSVLNFMSTRNDRIATELDQQGLETELHWQMTSQPLEYAYDHGFEYEHLVPLSELQPEQRQLLESQRHGADGIIVEEVDRMDRRSYEAFYFKNQTLVAKVGIDENTW